MLLDAFFQLGGELVETFFAQRLHVELDEFLLGT